MNLNTSFLLPPDRELNALIASGGDDRLFLTSDLDLNAYGCSPYPRYRLNYSSSTACNISMPAYSILSSLYQEILSLSSKKIDANEWSSSKFNDFRQRLFSLYELPENYDCIFGASGTDLELAAIALAKRSEDEKVLNIILGPEEVGSGIEYIGNGQYFKNHTIEGKKVTIGSHIPGFNEVLSRTVKVSIRDPSGYSLSSKDICKKIEGIISNCQNNERVLVHAIHRSKTGLIAPLIKDLKKCLSKTKVKYEIVVDCCQGRISPKVLKCYLESKAMVLFTGSKFFGAPPLCGALLVPCHLLDKNQVKAEGLKDFFMLSEWPQSLNRKPPTSNKVNLGLILRWEAALYEMERFFAIDAEKVKLVTDIFINEVNNFLSENNLYSGGFEKDPPEFHDNYPSSTFKGIDKNTICTLIISDKTLDFISYEDSKLIYQYLYSDISPMLPSVHRDLGKYEVHLGQPVKTLETQHSFLPTLRLSLGAPAYSDLYFLPPEKIKKKFRSDFKILKDKTSAIIENILNR